MAETSRQFSKISKDKIFEAPPRPDPWNVQFFEPAPTPLQRLFGRGAIVASESKCLAQSNKSRTGGNDWPPPFGIADQMFGAK
jgi:hypothetical protein